MGSLSDRCGRFDHVPSAIVSSVAPVPSTNLGMTFSESNGEAVSLPLRGDRSVTALVQLTESSLSGERCHRR